MSHESFVSEMVESSEVDMERAGIDLKVKVRRRRCESEIRGRCFQSVVCHVRDSFIIIYVYVYT